MLARLPQRSAVMAGSRAAPMRTIAPVAAPSMPSMSCVMGGMRLGERDDGKWGMRRLLEDNDVGSRSQHTLRSFSTGCTFIGDEVDDDETWQ